MKKVGIILVQFSLVLAAAAAAATDSVVLDAPVAVSPVASPALPAQGAPTPDKPSGPGEELSGAQKNIGDFTADFSLTVKGAAKNGKDFTAQGKLWLASGRRYRVQYTQPERQLLVSDGKQRWLYLEKINQVQIQALPPAGDANEFFLELGGGLPALVARCQVKRLAAEETKEQRAYQLTPRPNESLQFQQVKIWISRADQLPRRVVVEAERRVEARFKNISIHTLKQLSQAPDKGLPPSRFTFQAPKDAEVIEMLWPSK